MEEMQSLHRIAAEQLMSLGRWHAKGCQRLSGHCMHTVTPALTTCLKLTLLGVHELHWKNVGLLLWGAGSKADVAHVEGLHAIETQSQPHQPWSPANGFTTQCLLHTETAEGVHTAM